MNKIFRMVCIIVSVHLAPVFPHAAASAQDWRHLPVADPQLTVQVEGPESMNTLLPSTGGPIHPAPAGTIPISYYNPAYPLRKWIFPATYTPILIVGFGQRITLPGAGGAVESVELRIDSTSLDGTIGVLLWPDTLYPTARGNFHLPHIFSTEVQPYVLKTVNVKDVRPGEFITVPMDRTRVPTEFFIVVNSQVSGTIMKLVGDSGPVVPRTAENARSVFIAINQGGQVLTAILDSAISFGGSPTYCNFYITANVDTTTITGIAAPAGPDDVLLSVYPQPVSTTALLTVIHPSGSFPAGTLRIHDVLGREVKDYTTSLQSGAESHIAFSVHDLPAGTYVARYALGAKTVLRRFHVIR